MYYIINKYNYLNKNIINLYKRKTILFNENIKNICNFNKIRNDLCIYEKNILKYNNLNNIIENINNIHNKKYSNLKKLNLINPTKIRNVAIIAHVDHGKTTLVDKLLKGNKKENKEEYDYERILDYNDLEKERGITIMSKVTRIEWKDFYFNIVDTPGHADFGGEVERVLNLIDGVCLIIDVVEGIKNQTRYVLKKCLLNKNCKIIVIMNKFDKPTNIKKKEEIENEVFDLFADLNAPDNLMNYPILYASAKNGWCTDSFEVAKSNIKKNDVNIIFEKIIEYFNAPYNNNDNDNDNNNNNINNDNNNNNIKKNILNINEWKNNIINESFSMLVSMIDYQENLGITVTGKIYSGLIKIGDTIIIKNENNEIKGNCVIKNIFYMKGIKNEYTNYASKGDIINLSFSKGVIPSVNDTLVSDKKIESIKSVKIDPPFLSIKISQNTSPLTGKDGKYITLSSIGERLKKEATTNIAIEVIESEKKDSYEIKGRGELQLGILIEKLRREEYEMTVSAPNVIYTKDNNGDILEPIEEFDITVPTSVSSNVIEKLNTRKAEIIDIINDENDTTFIKCICPSKNFFGMRSYLRDISKGSSIINSELKEYKKKINFNIKDRNGVIISSANGITTGFSLNPIQMKGNLFVNENFQTYEGMIIGEHFLSNDIEVNCVKAKPKQNFRSKKHEENIKINHKNITVEYAISFIQDDEEIEVTPKRIAIRKKILNTEERKNANKKMKNL